MLRIVLPAVAAVMLFAHSAAAQPGRRPQQQPPQKPISGEGSEFFRALLNVRGVKPVKDQELASVNLGETIVIVIGNANLLSLGPGQHLHLHAPREYLIDALRHGGASLVATSNALDIPFDLEQLFINGQQVRCTDRASIFGGQFDCPYAVPETGPGPLHHLFGGDGAALKPLTHVVAGEPCSMQFVKGFELAAMLQPLARFPNKSIQLERQVGQRIVGTPLPNNALFAAGCEVPHFNHPSRFVAFASDRLFNNALLSHSSVENQARSENVSDNLQLAWRTLDYLEGPNHERKKCLFIENGRLIDHFDDLARMSASQVPMPLPSINLGAHQPELVKKANQLVERLETNNVLNRITSREGIRLGLLLFMAFVAAVVAAWSLMSRMFSSRKPSLPPPPTVAPATDGPPGVFERRQREIIRRKNLYEPVREIIREFFVAAGVHGEPGRKMPPVWVDEEVRRPRSLCLALKDFWKLAYGSPSVLSLEQWLAMEPYFERIRRAHADGLWKFQPE